MYCSPDASASTVLCVSLRCTVFLWGSAFYVLCSPGAPASIVLCSLETLPLLYCVPLRFCLYCTVSLILLPLLYSVVPRGSVPLLYCVPLQLCLLCAVFPWSSCLYCSVFPWDCASTVLWSLEALSLLCCVLLRLCSYCTVFPRCHASTELCSTEAPPLNRMVYPWGPPPPWCIMPLRPPRSTVMYRTVLCAPWAPPFILSSAGSRGWTYFWVVEPI